MEIKPNCSLKSHKESVAISYCEQCKKYMCNKCLNYHKELFDDHQISNLDKNNGELFIDICKKIGHEKKLEFFCKDHNELCCTGCVTKIEYKGYGQHKDCNICSIDDIKEEKKNKLNENIKFLQNLKNNFDNTINELKILFENINKKKEELKLYVQKIFTKFRSAINEREDELLSEIDKKFDDNFCKEDIIEESIKLPNKIKKYLEKGQLPEQNWNDESKLSSLINYCNNIEKNIKYINSLNDNIEKCKTFNDDKIIFMPEDESIDKFIQSIKSFGEINVFIPLNNIDSLILKSKEEIMKFNKLISKRLKITDTNLLYRASRDGVEFKNVADKINNKGNLIFLYLTGNERIFGNYVKIKLENLGSQPDKYYTDENAFVFSLNNNKIYKILKPHLAIRFYIQKYPILTGNNGQSNGFYLGSTITDRGLLKEPKVYDFEKNYELTEQKKNFNELEIFEII